MDDNDAVEVGQEANRKRIRMQTTANGNIIKFRADTDLVNHISTACDTGDIPPTRIYSPTSKQAKVEDACPPYREEGAHRSFYSWAELKTRLYGSDANESIDKVDGLLTTANEDKLNSDRHLHAGKLMRRINESMLGFDTDFLSPFGRRRVFYADYIASSRALSFIEDYIRTQVLSTYANTHSTGSVCALQTTMFRHEARQIIRNATNASADDAVIFCGSGSTAALNKLIRCMNFTSNDTPPPYVFCTSYEHHSNMLPWRECGAEVRMIGELSNGEFNYADLEQQLIAVSASQGAQRRLVIGAFTACSNVTGMMLDADRVSRLLHRYGNFVIFDYAACAPYVRIDMNPIERECSKDAVVLSTHKFIGGPQTPGMLIVKKRLLTNPVPETCGGGTVFFVSNDSHRYLLDVETREEGGTPAIIESIRAGLVFKLKESVGVEAIMLREHDLWHRARRRLLKMKNLNVLGPMGKNVLPTPKADPVSNPSRLPIVSFVIRHETTGLLLHHHFVVAVLNDVFGLQIRGGCMCAGPYAQQLLGIDADLARRFESRLLEDARFNEAERRGPVAPPRDFSVREHLRPGFARFSLPYFMQDAECDYLLDALELVAAYGWQLLPQYLLNPETGEWHHRDQTGFKERKWLSSISFLENFSAAPPDASSTVPANADKNNGDYFNAYLSEARENILSRDVCRQMAYRSRIGEQSQSYDEKSKELLWFLLPSEARAILLSGDDSVRAAKQIIAREPVFEPRRYAVELSDSTSVQSTVENILSAKTAESHRDRQQHLTTNGEALLTDESLVCDSHQAHEAQLVCPTRTKNSTVNESKPAAPLHRWWGPTKRIWKRMISAIKDFDMIRNGDRVLVCLSGGKDSLSLLHGMRQYQLYSRAQGVQFELGAVTIDPGSTSFDPRPLKTYLAALGGVPYFYEEHCIMQLASTIDKLASICSFCSRMKRGTIYSCARREGYNVLAIGQHLDDFAEGFMMSCFCNGKMRTMKAHYTIAAKDGLRVIRPLVYIRERDTRQFAQLRALPVITDNCPACFAAPEMRHRIKQMLAQQELLLPNLFDSLLAALKPFMAIQTVDVENSLRQLPMLLKYKAAYDELHALDKDKDLLTEATKCENEVLMDDEEA